MDVQIKKALGHPKRTEILGYLMQTMGVAEQGADEVELADALGMTSAKVRYHLTVLCDADLISRTDDSKPGIPDRYIACSPSGQMTTGA